MASVLPVSKFQPTRAEHVSGTEPLSLCLDLSLGGLFSTQFNSSQTRQPLQNSSPTADSTASSGTFMPKTCRNAHMNVSSFLKFDMEPFPNSQVASASIEARSLQSERMHDKRKKSESHVDCNLQKRGKLQEDNCSKTDTRAAPTSFLEFLRPVSGKDREELSMNEAETLDSCTSEAVVCALDRTKSETKLSEATHKLLPATPVSMLSTPDNRVQRSCNPAPHSTEAMKTENRSKGLHKVDADQKRRAFMSHVQSSYNLPVESDSVRKEVCSDLETEARSSASVSSYYFRPSALHESQQKSRTDAGQSDDRCCQSCSQETFPARGSSSQLSTNMGKQPRTGYDVSDKVDSVDGSCNSNSEIAYEQGNTNSSQVPTDAGLKELQADKAQSGITAGCAYPLLIMPLPHPCGPPVPWTFPYPWFVQSLPSTAPSHCSPMSLQTNEAFVTPFSGFPDSCHSLPVQPASSVTPWFPVAPAGVGDGSALPETLIPVIPHGVTVEKFVMPGNQSRDFSGAWQATEARGNYSHALIMRPVSMKEEQKDNAATIMDTQSIPTKELWREPCLFPGDSKCPSPQSRPNMHPGIVQVSSKDALKAEDGLCKATNTSQLECKTVPSNFSSAGRQQSLPLKDEKPPKKKKIVRFSSLTVAETREIGEGIHSAVVASNMFVSQQCVGAEPSTNQPNIQMASGGDGDEDDKLQPVALIISHNTSTSSENLADGARHSDSTTVEAEMDPKKAARDCSGTSPPLKSALKNKSRSRQPLASLPRVVTRGSGPHGKTIHGVMYITAEKQVRLICVCHGEHMSPVEFVQHSGSSDLSNPERSIVLESFSYGDSNTFLPLAA